MSDVNQSLDSRRDQRDANANKVDRMFVGFNAVRPIFQFYAAVLRQWSEACELMARNTERQIESLSGRDRDRDQQQQHQQQQQH